MLVGIISTRSGQVGIGLDLNDYISGIGSTYFVDLNSAQM